MRFILSLLLLCCSAQLMAAPAKKSKAKAKAKTVAKGKTAKGKASNLIPIADRGEACGHIAIDVNAPRTVQFAAKELQNCLQMITTARYPIQHNAPTNSWKPTIFVLGTKNCPIIKQYAAPGSSVEKMVKKLKDDGYCVIPRSGNKILIIGNNPRGVLNGVHRFIYKHTDFVWVRPYKELAIYTESPTLKLAVMLKFLFLH